MTDDQIAQHINKYVRSLGRLLGKANATSGSQCLGFLYVASCRLEQLGQLAESQGFVPPEIAVELAADYIRQVKAVGYGEVVVQNMTARAIVITRGPDGWSARLKTAD